VTLDELVARLDAEGLSWSLMSYPIPPASGGMTDPWLIRYRASVNDVYAETENPSDALGRAIQKFREGEPSDPCATPRADWKALAMRLMKCMYRLPEELGCVCPECVDKALRVDGVLDAIRMAEGDDDDAEPTRKGDGE
jgi:hypothetical protein